MEALPARDAADLAARRPDEWILPVAGALLYPSLLHGFFLAVQVVRGASGNALKASGFAVFAVLLVCLAVAVPALALRALLRIRSSTEPAAPLIRRVLHAVIATPPLYILFGKFVRIWGVNDAASYLWWGGWGLIALVTWRWRPSSRWTSRPRSSTALRVTHGVAAMLLLTGFLVMHLANHLVALWTIEAHQAVMKTLRLWYRADAVEPVVLGLCALMVVTGVCLVGLHTRATQDRFRSLQTAAGGYFVAFMASHVWAVLGGRAAHVDTDWIFATVGDRAGLLAGTGTDLIPYYALSVLLVVVHASLGLRIVLLTHGIQAVVANRVVYVVSALGGVATVAILAALLGLHLGT